MMKSRHNMINTEHFTDRKRLVLFFVFGAAALIIVVVLFYTFGRRLEISTHAKEEPRGSLSGRFEELPRFFSSDGKDYRYRSGLTTILFMGVDQTSDQVPSPIQFRSGGQADFLLLLVIDSQEEKITSLQIDRDTMTEISVLGVLGDDTGKRNAQICLSHSFGDGREQSAGFTVKAVSDLLFGVNIDYYVAMNLNGIVALNDVLGGVTVTLAEDFTALDPTMRKGDTLTLHGKQAEYYVRSRMIIGDGTNVARMMRQKDYLGKAGAIISNRIRDNANFIGRVFDALRQDLVTNMSRGRMINEAYACRNYTRPEMISPQGEHTADDKGYVEFYVDERALESLVLEVFYEPVGAEPL